MDTEAESHGEQFELDKLFEPDESIKLFKLEEQFGPDELKEFFELREQFQQDEQFEQGEQVVEIELDKLVPFGNHPFKLFQGRRLDDMIDEIGEPKLVVDEAKDMIYPKHTGIRILSPVIVRPVNNGQYEILDGHYRVAAARKLKSELKLNSVKVPAVIKTGLTDEEALSYVSKSNPIGLLLKYKIDISCNDYRTTKEFKRLNNHYMIFSDRYSPMSLREYIEHILLDRYRVNVMYQNKYSMGNTYKLKEEECTDEAVAREIIRRNDPESEKMMEEWLKSNDPNDKSAYRSEEKEIENEVKKLVHTFNREGGYIQQLKNHLGVDLNSDSFDYRNIQNHRERAKILFLISNLRQKKVSLQMYSKPSMENVDNSFLGWKTYNGFYARFLMRTVEREIAPGLKTNIRKAVSFVVNSWGDHMISFDMLNSFLSHVGYDCSEYVDLIAANMQKSFTYQEPTNYTFQSLTPLGLLYLKLVQSEYLGQMYDLLSVYKLTADVDYHVPSAYLEAMWKFEAKHMSREDIEAFFTPENVREKAKYIYLKENVSTEERRRIRNSKEKVLRFLDFFNLADPFGEYNMMDNITELLIISCLQSILLDKQDEIFYYKFYRFEGKKGDRKGVIRVQAALKNDAHTYDALRVYWVRRVMDRSYANVGDSKMRAITSKFEEQCVNILVKILKCSSIEEMLAMNSFYSERLTE